MDQTIAEVMDSCMSIVASEQSPPAATKVSQSPVINTNQQFWELAGTLGSSSSHICILLYHIMASPNILSCPCPLYDLRSTPVVTDSYNVLYCKLERVSFGMVIMLCKAHCRLNYWISDNSFVAVLLVMLYSCCATGVLGLNWPWGCQCTERAVYEARPTRSHASSVRGLCCSPWGSNCQCDGCR